MFLKTLLLASLSFLGVSQIGSDVAGQNIQQLQRRFIGDIGYATVNRQGTPVVVMNPAACRRLGPELCSFFQAHERAHHQLGHFQRNISIQQKEAEADRYAAQVVSPAARAAAQRFFASGKGGDRLHGSSQQRLARVSQPYQPAATNGSTTPRYNQSRSNVRLSGNSRFRRVWVPVSSLTNR